MIKQHYLQELNIQSPYVKKGDSGTDVKRVQEWIKLWHINNRDFDAAISIDADFGNGTLRAVKKFQTYKKELAVDGIVGDKTWRALTEPLLNAFSLVDKSNINQLILAYAKAHEKAGAHEFWPNKGPWVRAYMDGHEGRSYPWCMGFVQTVLDQAYSTLGQNFTDYATYTYGCDQLAAYGIKNNLLIEKENLKNEDVEKEIKPGDVFLKFKLRSNGTKDWTHTGFVYKVTGTIIETIEGNSNDEGSREGVETCFNKRDFAKQNLDFYKVTIE